VPLASGFFAASGDIPLSGLPQLGAVGVILTILFWFSWQVYKRERDRADANEAEIRRLNELITSKYAANMADAVRVLGEVNDLLIRMSERGRTR
jgi:hypothetical protein